MKHCYSPLPIDSYRLIGQSHDEIGPFLSLEEAPAIWNMFWLSVPSLDSIPGAGSKWWKVYKTVPNAVASIIRDVLDDEVLFRKVQMHPAAFIDWFEREDHSIYYCYDALGGESWVQTVLARAQIVVDRLLAASPVVVTRGNVIAVDFRRAA